ncbi:type II toxin-antitoxin system PemK/MazF family toxin [Turicimonas muris]|uniref:Type II toxin-antitoxin system PemK/MazF family toxin n=1 Tax=Turicimonas muris TaxID=1796652 RepID=A0A227KNP4_9BURK|nr:type II toxin-antitoxin system PemK/MazF family toxin [Turicimonas muris]ANU66060.1 hypothetical protein A4V04_06290 [Burkholderiales bacterium YL45]OXE49709.1 hypothetical protein ADH67_06175 [Turicimonas muris]QQQ97211.1 type II toxin-antitoxin system PemK/MazF family toxin [Turicimonas muris]
MSRDLREGDIIFVDFDPAFGQEQAGKRPALVLSTFPFNRRSNKVIVAAISQGACFSRDQGMTVSLIGAGTQTQGVVICDQIRTIDVVARKAFYIETVPDFILETVLGKLVTIIGIEPE